MQLGATKIGDKTRIIFPWPAAVLNPNKSAHWATKGRARKKQREEACFIAKGARVKFLDNNINVSITFFPPDNRRRDVDNMIASCKSLFDGMAEAWKVDDRRFKLTVDVGPKTKLGRVVVEV